MDMAPTPKRTSTADRLGPEDWTKAALAAIADKGTANVSVERLARELGATKGSFYWHFKDRPALIDAALQRWERDFTDRIIERLSGIADPRERFRKLLESSFEDHPGVLIDANLLAAEAPADRVAGNAYNIGGGEPCDLLDILAHLERIIGPAKPPHHTEPRAGDVRHTFADLTAARRDLGYDPKTSVADGLERTVEWFTRT